MLSDLEENMNIMRKEMDDKKTKMELLRMKIQYLK